MTMKRTRQNYPKNKIALVCEMYSIGYDITQICRIHKIDRTTVYRWIDIVFGRKIKNPEVLTLKSKIT